MRPPLSQPSSHSGRTTGMFISTAFSQAMPRPSVVTKCVVSIRTESASLAPIRSMMVESPSRRWVGRIPGVTVIPLRSVILCVLTVTFSLLKVPALVRSTRWKVYSVSTANPLILVLCITVGFGILPAFCPLRKSESDIMSAVARSIGSHSSTTDVCVALRQRRTGAEGSNLPKEAYTASCRAMKEACDSFSESKLRETVMSTMLPEEILGGRRMDGNSIWKNC